MTTWLTVPALMKSISTCPGHVIRWYRNMATLLLGSRILHVLGIVNTCTWMTKWPNPCLSHDIIEALFVELLQLDHDECVTLLACIPIKPGLLLCLKLERTKPSLFLTDPLAHTYHYQTIQKHDHASLLGVAESCMSLVLGMLAPVAKSFPLSATAEWKDGNIDVLLDVLLQHINIIIFLFSCGGLRQGFCQKCKCLAYQGCARFCCAKQQSVVYHLIMVCMCQRMGTTGRPFSKEQRGLGPFEHSSNPPCVT